VIRGRSVAVTTGVMDRTEYLLRALPTWLALEGVDRVCVVDWGSDPPLRGELEERFGDPRLVVARVEARTWHHSRCHNLELGLVLSHDLVLRLDSDVLVRPDLLSRRDRPPGFFWTVDWRKVPAGDDLRNVAGTLLAAPEDVFRAGGYCERLDGYGSEDDELYDRMSRIATRLDLDLECLEHLPHGDELRYRRLAVAPRLPELMSRVGTPEATVSGLRGPTERDLLCSMAEREVLDRPWTPADRPTEWKHTRVTSRYLECAPIAPRACSVDSCVMKVAAGSSSPFCSFHHEIYMTVPRDVGRCRCACHVAGVPCELCQVAHTVGDPS
jgi:hypothetical protein